MHRISSLPQIVSIIWMYKILLFPLILIFNKRHLKPIILVDTVFPPRFLLHVKKPLSLRRDHPSLIQHFPGKIHINFWYFNQFMGNITLSINKRYLFRVKRFQPDRSFLVAGTHPSSIVVEVVCVILALLVGVQLLKLALLHLDHLEHGTLEGKLFCIFRSCPFGLSSSSQLVD